MSISDTEVRIIAAIETYWSHNKKGPTYLDLSYMTAMAPSTTWRHVQKLARTGVVTIDEGKHRSISITPSTYTVWSVEMSNGQVLQIVCDGQDRAKSIALARRNDKYPFAHIINISKSVRNLAEIEAETEGKFELVAIARHEDEEGENS